MFIRSISHGLCISFAALAILVVAPAVTIGQTTESHAPPLKALAASQWQDAAPEDRIRRDWMMQDFQPEVTECFSDKEGSTSEAAAVGRVLDELNEHAAPFRGRFDELMSEKTPGNDPAWRELYFEACVARRKMRLAMIAERFPQIVYTKHYNIGGSHYAYTENPTDAQSAERGRTNSDWRMGSALCLLQVSGDGQTTSRTLLDEPDGLIRDPDVSYDGQRIVFSRRDTAFEDDFHLYEMSVGTSAVRQLTFGLGFGDIEPAYLPNGDLVFNSTRCMQITDCFWTDVGNLYLCSQDGHFLRRIGFDQVHTNYPKVLEDGRVTYTRWDYNDRGQVYPQPLFVMNYDGTGQAEYYGNNSWFPTTIMHARGIPGSQKLIAVASGHHSHQRGKLILIDRGRGTQENSGVQLIAPVRDTPADRIDAYGQVGDQFQYPYALDETHYLITYDPVGSPGRAYNEPYGVYYMDIDGRRELLAWDPEISCNQSVPLAPRAQPHLRASTIDYTERKGDYYIQDVYAGEGLVGVPRGTIKKIRVVAIEYRAAGIRSNQSRGPAGGALSSTPVSIGNGCWDVKKVLGDAEVYEDGSAWFEVPSQTPVYFQTLDEHNRAVQTMRSWSTLQPGESQSCVGCHEAKRNTPLTNMQTVAAGHGPKRLESFHRSVRGFSYEQDIQPILDRHCIECHHDRSAKLDWDKPLVENDSLPKHAFSLLGDTTDDPHAGRHWADSYLALTAATQPSEKRPFQGQPNRLVKWITTQSEPSMLPPYHAGSTQGSLYDLLQRGHADVKLSVAELDRIACWIDLGVPYCGDYIEANIWSEREMVEYAYYQAKRDRMSEIERLGLTQYLAHQTGDISDTKELPVFDAGGPERKRTFLEAGLKREIPVVDRRRGAENKYRNLAVNSDANQGLATSYPHASSNSEYRSLAHFAAKSVIDGKADNRGHGPKYPSWGPHQRTDLWWKVELGRNVEIDKVAIYLRADFPHDAHWHSGTIRFSDGTEVPIELQKTAEPQVFSFDKRTVSWLELTDLVQDLPLGWCGFSEVEVWGRDCE